MELHLKSGKVLPAPKNIERLNAFVNSFMWGNWIDIRHWNLLFGKLLCHSILNRLLIASFYQVYKHLPRFRNERRASIPQEKCIFYPKSEQLRDIRSICSFLPQPTVKLKAPFYGRVIAFDASYIDCAVVHSALTSTDIERLWNITIKRQVTQNRTPDRDPFLEDSVSREQWKTAVHHVWTSAQKLPKNRKLKEHEKSGKLIFWKQLPPLWPQTGRLELNTQTLESFYSLTLPLYSTHLTKGTHSRNGSCLRYRVP